MVESHSTGIGGDLFCLYYPENADKGTIRKIHALNVQENSVHGSDSEENAIKEIDFFFDLKEIVG